MTSSVRMKKSTFSWLRILGIGVFSLSGWLVVWSGHGKDAGASQASSVAKTDRGRGFPDRRPKPDPRNPSRWVADPSFAQLLSSLSEISKSAPAGEPNPKLLHACELALSNPDPQRRARDFNLLMELMRPEDAAAIHQQFLEIHQSGKGYGPEYGAFAKRWGEIDAPGALDFLMAEKPFRLPALDFQEIARGWGQTDPRAAVEWMKAHPEISDSMDGRYALLDGWFRIDPTSATRWMLDEGMPSRELAHCISGGAWQQLFSQDAVQAAQWLSELPDDHGEMAAATKEGWRAIQMQLTQLSYDQASTAFSQIAGASWVGLEEFKNFGNLVSRATANSEGMAGFLNSVAAKWPAEQVSRKFEQWANANPDATREWLINSPDSALLAPALNGAIRAFDDNGQSESAAALRKLLK